MFVLAFFFSPDKLCSTCCFFRPPQLIGREHWTSRQMRSGGICSENTTTRRTLKLKQRFYCRKTQLKQHYCMVFSLNSDFDDDHVRKMHNVFADVNFLPLHPPPSHLINCTTKPLGSTKAVAIKWTFPHSNNSSFWILSLFIYVKNIDQLFFMLVVWGCDYWLGYITKNVTSNVKITFRTVDRATQIVVMTSTGRHRFFLLFFPSYCAPRRIFFVLRNVEMIRQLSILQWRLITVVIKENTAVVTGINEIQSPTLQDYISCTISVVYLLFWSLILKNYKEEFPLVHES